MSGSSDDATAPETWIGVVSLLPDGERFALAWVRLRDEWLADAAIAKRGDELTELSRMYRDAVAKRGHAPDRLNVRARAHADALRSLLGSTPEIVSGFDGHAQELSDEAARAVDVAFAADALVPLGPRYHPEFDPDPAEWLALSEDDRHELIHLAHLGEADDLRGRHLQMHVGMHDAVEMQVAKRDPAETALTLARLQLEGLSRHEAVHAIAALLMATLQHAMTSGEPFDVATYEADLRNLTGSRA